MSSKRIDTKEDKVAFILGIQAGTRSVNETEVLLQLGNPKVTNLKKLTNDEKLWYVRLCQKSEQIDNYELTKEEKAELRRLKKILHS